MNVLTTFIHTVFLSFIALFPVINPIGTSFVINPYFAGLSKEERRKMVFKVSLYTFYICIATLFVGQWILQLFGLSIPVVRLAGGLVICKIGWDLLSGVSQDTNHSDIDKKGNITDKLFYPITFPMTAGTGTISVLFTLSAHSQSFTFQEYVLNTAAILLAILFLCVLVYVFFLSSNTVIEKIGKKNETVINRIVAFLIFCVGIQIAAEGAMTLFFTK